MKFAVVGLGMGGSHGARVHAIDGCEYAAMCDLNSDLLEARAKGYKEEIGAEPKPFSDVQEMLSSVELDGVIISTPTSTHHIVAEIVANAGVNILVDKPLDINAENMSVIEAAVKKTNALCGVIYPLRCMPVFSGVKHVIENNLLGKPLMCDVRLKWFREQAYYDKGGWRGTWKTDGGGSLMNQGAHPLDILCWLLGKPKTVVGAFAPLNHKVETEDWASGIVEFESGARSTITTTTCAAPKQDKTCIDLHCENGSIYIENGEVVFSSIENLETIAPPAYPYPVEDFVDAVKNKRAPMVSIEEAKHSVLLINAIYESGREGKRITI